MFPNNLAASAFRAPSVFTGHRMMECPLNWCYSRWSRPTSRPRLKPNYHCCLR